MKMLRPFFRTLVILTAIFLFLLPAFIYSPKIWAACGNGQVWSRIIGLEGQRRANIEVVRLYDGTLAFKLRGWSNNEFAPASVRDYRTGEIFYVSHWQDINVVVSGAGGPWAMKIFKGLSPYESRIIYGTRRGNKIYFSLSGTWGLDRSWKYFLLFWPSQTLNCRRWAWIVGSAGPRKNNLSVVRFADDGYAFDLYGGCWSCQSRAEIKDPLSGAKFPVYRQGNTIWVEGVGHPDFIEVFGPQGSSLPAKDLFGYPTSHGIAFNLAPTRNISWQYRYFNFYWL